MIGGFIVQGIGPKKLIVRAIGLSSLNMAFPMRSLIRHWSCTTALEL